MRRALIFVVATVFVLALLSRTVTYTVRFTEAAVRTTFGKADMSDVQTDPGLKFKWPDPIQSVIKYDTRVRFLQARIEQQQTADNNQIVVEAYCTWRVKDPLLFFKRWSNFGDRADQQYKEAEKHVISNLRSAISEASKYRMDELFTAAGQPTKLPELEQRILTALRAADQGGSSLDQYGIEAVDVGINRILLPEENTKAVFERMREDRKKLVKELESAGDAQVTSITSAAKNNAAKIEAKATQFSEEIRAQGDLEIAGIVKQMSENPELAIFLKNIEFIKESLAKRVTMLFSTDMPGFELFSPDVIDRMRKGQVPGVQGLMSNTPAATEGAK